MRLLITTLLLIAIVSIAHADPREAFIDVQHDAHRGVTCWIMPGTGISCLPDSQLRNTDSMAGYEHQDGPSPAHTPAQHQHQEAYQL